MTTAAQPTAALDVRRVAVNDLKPHPNNPRHGDVDRIRESLRENGQFKPIVLAEDYTVIAGNHTYFAAAEEGWQYMDAVVLPIGPLSPAAVKIMLADNRTTDVSTYDNAELARLLQHLDNEGAGLYGTGYTTDNLDDLLALAEEGPLEFGQEDEDTLPTKAEKMERYQAMGRRMLVLDYDQETYGHVTGMLATMRTRYGVESNAECVERMAAELSGGVLRG